MHTHKRADEVDKGLEVVLFTENGHIIVVHLVRMWVRNYVP